ncbi:hypothetical protein L682_29125 [Aquipseudomonas alcaligenes OT 69]|nr:hypothetical protein L682_29125 [Pseudomonas alcaligenes OT 69]
MRQLDSLICALVRIGHHDVLRYPWGLFLRALKVDK